jgi:trigger factor
VNENFDWVLKNCFEYEIGLVPNFTLDQLKNDIVKYVVTADAINWRTGSKKNQKQFGTAIPQEVVAADSDVEHF